MSSSYEVRVAPQIAPVTEKLQSAIDSDDRPLRLILEPGVHRCGGLRLRSALTLEITAGAELHFIPDYEAYAHTPVSVVAEESDRAMIVATGAHDISIVGAGRIFCDGSTAFSHGDDGEMGTLVASRRRPRVMVLDECRHIRIEGLRIEDSPMWTLHLVDCESVDISGVSVNNNRRMPNTDAIVIDGSRNVTIRNCTLRTADDGIVLKTSSRAAGGRTGPCEDILVSHCTVESHSCALKIGTESFSPFRNISFEDMRLEGSNRGLGIFSRDGGTIENVRFSRVTLECHETPAGFWGSGEAVTINTIDRRPEDEPAGWIRDIVVEDVSGTMEGAINMVAERTGDISGITLRRLNLRQVPGSLGTALCYDVRPTPADRFDRFPADKGAGRVNAWRFGPDGRIIGLVDYPGGMPGVFAKGITRLTLEDVKIDRPDPMPENWNREHVVLC